MRLYCINNKPIPGTFNNPIVLAAIKEGEVYEGYMVSARNPNGEISKAWRIPAIYTGRDSYNISRFIPLPDEPAEVIEEQELETV